VSDHEAETAVQTASAASAAKPSSSYPPIARGAPAMRPAVARTSAATASVPVATSVVPDMAATVHAATARTAAASRRAYGPGAWEAISRGEDTGSPSSRPSLFAPADEVNPHRGQPGPPL
jgi:hypothetical protein